MISYFHFISSPEPGYVRTCSANTECSKNYCNRQTVPYCASNQCGCTGKQTNKQTTDKQTNKLQTYTYTRSVIPQLQISKAV